MRRMTETLKTTCAQMIGAIPRESVMAKTPEERARAEMRIARLQAQREKLMQQLATIKVRLLNESDKKLKM